MATINGLPITSETVIVLGAGFTRAFLPDAPLLIDDYDAPGLLRDFSYHRFARELLEIELKQNSDGRINIERLMSRLDGQMPYDASQGSAEQLALLMRELKGKFLQRINAAKKGDYLSSELSALASLCIEHGVNVVTFNYDDVLDEALWKLMPAKSGHIVEPYWHPDAGYGFFCKPAENCISERPAYFDKTAMCLYKLHGSMNWRLKLGRREPYEVDAVLHFEQWYPRQDVIVYRLSVAVGWAPVGRGR